MASNYSSLITSKKSTPQTKFIPGREQDQITNNAGGVSFRVDPFQQLERFLILGSLGGSYYANEKTLTLENAQVVIDLIKLDGARVLERAITVSQQGLAPKNDPAIFTLALVMTHANEEVKAHAYAWFTEVIRTGTHLFTFCQYIKDLRKWSRGLRSSVSSFYESRTPDQIALQLMKYRSRQIGGNTWTHRDVIRLAHPKFPKGAEGLALRALGKEGDALKDTKATANWNAFVQVQKLKEKKDISQIVTLIEAYRLPWEALSTEVLKFPEIWEALVPSMGYEALLRNLSRLAKIGLIDRNNALMTKVVEEKFQDVEQLRLSRLHPLKILNGLKAFSLGRSTRNYDETWAIAPRVVEALGDAFYAAFGNVTPTGKKFCLALDVSGSMSSGEVGQTMLSPREASVALALVTMNVEKDYELMAFSSGFIPLDNITRKTFVLDAINKTSQLPFDSTDCAQPMLWATKNKVEVDVFSVYTDSETFEGYIHASQALEKYRQAMGRDAKMVVVGMTSNGFTIADPKDPRQLDVVGFSLDTPQAISAFASLDFDYTN